MCLSRHNENLLVWQKLPPIYIKMSNTDIKRKSINYVAVIAGLNHFRDWCLHTRTSSPWVLAIMWKQMWQRAWNIAPPIPGETSWCSFFWLAFSVNTAIFSQKIQKASKSRNEIGFPTSFDNQVLLIARVFSWLHSLANFVIMFWVCWSSHAQWKIGDQLPRISDFLL